MILSDKINVDIISDVMCPWCVVGYKRFEQALKEREQKQRENYIRAQALNSGSRSKTLLQKKMAGSFQITTILLYFQVRWRLPDQFGTQDVY